MSTHHVFGEDSPYETYYQTDLPSTIELARMCASDLTRLSAKLAYAYSVVMPEYGVARIREVVSTPREFGIELKSNCNSSLLSLTARLKDRKWWGRKVSQLADETREHQAQLAGMLGGKYPNMACCSDATLEIFRERKTRSDSALKSQFKAKFDTSGNATVFSLYEISESAKKSRINELFLNVKAMEAIAENSSYGCAFITLTAAPEFHSNPKRGKSSYDGSTARAANMSIQKDWRSILDGFDNLGVKRKSGSYFGFRVVELHEDGCPHWHILLFFDKSKGIIESAEMSIKRLYKKRGSYFEGQKGNIVRIIEKSDDTTARPSSYIFNYIAYALEGGAGKDEGMAYRYKCAIRAMRARQYDFFGLKCAMGKQRALKSIARTEDAPKHIRKIAHELHLPKGANNRNERQLLARVEFLEGGAEDLEVGQDVVENRYGETVTVSRWIRHKLDNEAVQFTGLCEEITEEEAKRLRAEKTSREVDEVEAVTIITNYSRKAKIHRTRGRASTRLRIWMKYLKSNPLVLDQVRDENAAWLRALIRDARTLNAPCGRVMHHPDVIAALAALEERRSTRYISGDTAPAYDEMEAVQIAPDVR